MIRHLQLAPMQALTDVFFMNSYHQVFGGFTEMMAPYLPASSLSPMKLQNMQKYFGSLNKDITLIPQLLSNDARGFLHFANSLFDMGFTTINWNLGCPFIYVTKKQRGSGLLPHPDKINSLLEQIIPELKPKLSIKVRLGLSSEDEILPLIDIFNTFPIDEIIVHPRTATQKYEGKANIEAFGRILPQFKMPVIYNGDITTKEQAYQLENQHPNIKGFMIGRGAFINPFITNQINGIEDTVVIKLQKYQTFYFMLHHHYYSTTKTDQGFLSRMKELWFYFSQTFEQGESYLKILRSINDVPAFEAAATQIFEEGKLLF